jgi:hypothetical protein
VICISLIYILIWTYTYGLGILNGLFPSGVPNPSDACYMPCSSHPPWLDNLNYIWRRIHVMKLLVMKFSATSRYFVPLRLTHSSGQCNAHKRVTTGVTAEHEETAETSWYRCLESKQPLRYVISSYELPGIQLNATSEQLSRQLSRKLQMISVTNQECISCPSIHAAKSFMKRRQSLSYSKKISQYFMEREGSLPCSQEPDIGLCSQPDESSPYLLSSFTKI